jgi:hypothetical protein
MQTGGRPDHDPPRAASFSCSSLLSCTNASFSRQLDALAEGLVQDSVEE